MEVKTEGLSSTMTSRKRTEVDLTAEEKQQAATACLVPKVAFSYDTEYGISILSSYTGTFWPLVLKQVELYLYPIIHTVLVIIMWNHKRGQADDGTTPVPLISDDSYMIPWNSLGLSTSLMVFFLVFFLSQCYTRFNDYFNTFMTIEDGIHEMAMLALSNLSDKPAARWDCVRYLTAAAIVIYSRVTKTAEKGGEPQMSATDWERLLLAEREWQAGATNGAIADEDWQKIMGWPRNEADADKFAAEMKRKGLGTNNTGAPRKTRCPPLLQIHEVDALRQYPGGLMSFVLMTWATQTIMENHKNFPGPTLGLAQGAVFKLRQCAYRLRNQLGMPVPLPYLHALTMLQNLTFAIYCYAFLAFESYLTPLILFIVVLVTVGMREVGVALSNPFGKDDVDFPMDKWIAALRSMALVVHEDNTPITKPDPPDERARLLQKALSDRVLEQSNAVLGDVTA